MKQTAIFKTSFQVEDVILKWGVDSLVFELLQIARGQVKLNVLISSLLYWFGKRSSRRALENISFAFKTT